MSESDSAYKIILFDKDEVLIPKAIVSDKVIFKKNEVLIPKAIVSDKVIFKPEIELKKNRKGNIFTGIKGNITSIEENYLTIRTEDDSIQKIKFEDINYLFSDSFDYRNLLGAKIKLIQQLDDENSSSADNLRMKNGRGFVSFGVNIGSPGGLNLTGTFTKGGYVVRFDYGAFPGDWIKGYQLSAGACLNRSANSQNNLSLAIGYMSFWSFNDLSDEHRSDALPLLKQGSYLALLYDTYYYGFFLEVGVGASSGDDINFRLMFKAGYSYRFSVGGDNKK